MKFTLSDLIDNLAAAELSLTNIVDQATGEVSLETVNRRIIPVLNAALGELHSEFFLKRKEVWVQLCSGKTRYVLDRKNTKTANRFRGDASIDDCEDPFHDDIVEILNIYDEHGAQFRLNVDTTHESAKHGSCGCGHGGHSRTCRFYSTLDRPRSITTRHPYGDAYIGDLYNPHTIMTPAYNVIRVPEGLGDQWVRVVYKASPRRLKKIEDDGLYEPDRIFIDLPYSYLMAVVYFIAHRLTNANMQGVQQGFHEGNNYYQKYISACAILKDRGVDVDSVAESGQRFLQKGFI